jgi:hypothetical protein
LDTNFLPNTLPANVPLPQTGAIPKTTGAVAQNYRPSTFTAEERDIIRQLFVTADRIPTLKMEQIRYAVEQNKGGFRAIWERVLNDKDQDKTAAAQTIRAVQRQFCLDKPKLTRTHSDIPLSPNLKITPVAIRHLQPEPIARPQTRKQLQFGQSIASTFVEPTPPHLDFGQPETGPKQLEPQQRVLIRSLFYKKGEKPSVTVDQVRRCCSENPSFRELFEILLRQKGSERKVMETINGTVKSAYRSDSAN